VYTGPERTYGARLQLIRYQEDQFAEQQVDDVTQLPKLLAEPGVRWLNVVGVHDTKLLEDLGSALKLHPLTVEDLASLGQRPKVEEYEGYLFMVMRMLTRHGLPLPTDTPAPATTDGTPAAAAVSALAAGPLHSEQFSLVLQDNLLITFQELETDPFGPLRERLRTGRGRLRKMGADYLAYTLIDLVIDQYFEVLEAYGDDLESLEEEILRGPQRDSLQRVTDLRRDLLVVRRAVWPLRDVMGSLQRKDLEYFSPDVSNYLRDAHDHAVQVMDAVETQREQLTSLHDIYLTLLSVRMNDVMKVLTVISTIFIPLTFLAGIYGMNFENMPEYHWRWAYPLLWVIMLSLAGGMIVSFRRRGWL